MSRVGMGMSGGAWYMDPSVNFPAFFMPQGVSADLIATKYGFSRDDVDAYAVESQKRAAHAWENGYFNKSVIPVKDQNGLTILDRDEHMRPGTDMQALASLNPSFQMPGEMGGFEAVGIMAHPEVERINYVHHAGNSSGIVDGAAAVLVGSKAGGEAMGVKPRARIKAFANIGSDPALMLTGPVDVTEKLLKRPACRLPISIFRTQRSLRRRGPALHAGFRHQPRPDERQWRRHRHGPSAGCHRGDDPRHGTG